MTLLCGPTISDTEIVFKFDIFSITIFKYFYLLCLIIFDLCIFICRHWYITKKKKVLFSFIIFNHNIQYISLYLSANLDSKVQVIVTFWNVLLVLVDVYFIFQVWYLIVLTFFQWISCPIHYRIKSVLVSEYFWILPWMFCKSILVGLNLSRHLQSWFKKVLKRLILWKLITLVTLVFIVYILTNVQFIILKLLLDIFNIFTYFLINEMSFFFMSFFIFDQF